METEVSAVESVGAPGERGLDDRGVVDTGIHIASSTRCPDNGHRSRAQHHSPARLANAIASHGACALVL
jgi:hypothetical protein